MKRGADFALKPWEHQPAEAKEAAVTAAVEAIRSIQGAEEAPVSSEVVAHNLQRWVSTSAWSQRKAATKLGKGAHPARARSARARA
jgi:hypothetical protein